MQMAKQRSKYQIVIPTRVREALGLRPGDRLLIAAEDDKGVMRLCSDRFSRLLQTSENALIPVLQEEE
jgi:AbrB family looped-hinge helix DNA binding protein